MLTSLLFVLAVADDPLIAGKELPKATLPVFRVHGIPEGAIANITEYRSDKSPFVTRVFRYVWKADYSKTVELFRNSLPKNEGWKNAPVSRTETDFWRMLKHGKTVQQGLIVQANRLIKDSKSPTGWKSLPYEQSKGWVWISYNEQFRP